MHSGCGGGRYFLWEPLGKGTFERPWISWEENIKINLRELGNWEWSWVKVTQDRIQWRALVFAVFSLLALLPQN